MSQRKRQINGDIRQESPQKQVKRLAQQLSDTERRLQLSEQIRNQLEKVSDTTTQIKDISYRLLYEIADLSDKELKDLHNKETAKNIELKKLKQRLQMLRDVETNECSLGVKFMAYKKSNKPNVILINNKQVFVDKSEANYNIDEDTEEEDTTEEEDESAYGDRITRSRHSSYGTHSQTADSWQSFEMEGELKDLKPYRSGRKRIIPKRFESFPGGVSKRSRGMSETIN